MARGAVVEQDRGGISARRIKPIKQIPPGFIGPAVPPGALAVMLGVVQQMTAATQRPQIRRIVMFRHMVQMRRGENDASALASGEFVPCGIAQPFAGRGVVNRAGIYDGEGRTGGAVVTNNQRAIRNAAKLATTLISPSLPRSASTMPLSSVWKRI